jgi:hypothetical protein
MGKSVQSSPASSITVVGCAERRRLIDSRHHRKHMCFGQELIKSRHSPLHRMESSGSTIITRRQITLTVGFSHNIIYRIQYPSLIINQSFSQNRNKLQSHSSLFLACVWLSKASIADSSRARDLLLDLQRQHAFQWTAPAVPTECLAGMEKGASRAFHNNAYTKRVYYLQERTMMRPQ